MRFLAIIALLAMSSCATTPHSDEAFEDDFFVENYGDVFGLYKSGSDDCINAVAGKEIVGKLSSVVGDENDIIQDDERILLKISISPLDVKIHEATRVHRLGELMTSSAPWITFEGEQKFLLCDREEVFEIIDYRDAD